MATSNVVPFFGNMKQLVIPGGNGELKLYTTLPSCFEIIVLSNEEATKSGVMAEPIINVTSKRGEIFFIEISNPCVAVEECKIGLLPDFLHTFLEKYKAQLMQDPANLPINNITVFYDILNYPHTYCLAMPLDDVELMRHVIRYCGTGMFTIDEACGFEIDELMLIANEYKAAIVGQEPAMHPLLKDEIIRQHFRNLTRPKARVYFNALRKRLGMLKNRGLVYDVVQGGSNNFEGRNI